MSSGSNSHSNSSRQVGFLGLGLMGIEMSKILIQNSNLLPINVYNRTISKVENLKSELASNNNNNNVNLNVIETPSEMALKTDLMFAMLADPSASLTVAESIAEGLKMKKEQKTQQTTSSVKEKKSVYVEMSTIDAQTSQAIKILIEQYDNCYFLSAPVSGGIKDAREGNLLIMAAGDQTAYDTVQPEFNILGKNSWFVGETCEDSTNTKLALQIMMGGQTALLAECLAFCEHNNVNEKIFTDILSQGAMKNPLLTSVGNRIQKGIEKNRSWEKSSFQLYLQQKDLRLAIETSNKNGLGLPLCQAVYKQFEKADQKGHTYEDMASVRDAYEKKRNGLL